MNKSKELIRLCEKLSPPKVLPEMLSEVLQNIEERRKKLDPTVYHRKNPEKK